jgi:hypothetical protein
VVSQYPDQGKESNVSKRIHSLFMLQSAQL